MLLGIESTVAGFLINPVTNTNDKVGDMTGIVFAPIGERKDVFDKLATASLLNLAVGVVDRR